MCLKRYKNTIRGAFALVISYLEVAEYNSNTRRTLIEVVTKYLKDNHISLEIGDNALVPIKIVRAGESVVLRNRSMDVALRILSLSLRLELNN